jgi:hypothetical protein
MKREILKISEYRNIPILVRRIGNAFEYVFVHDKKFYSAHNIFAIPLLRFSRDYTKTEKHNGAEFVFKQAEATIDELLKTK